MCVKASVCKSVCDAIYCLVLVLCCYIVLILLFSTAYNTSLIYCFVRYCFVIWCLHTNKRRPCSSTLSGHPSSSFSASPGKKIIVASEISAFLAKNCRRSARSCGAKHISKSKCTKHTTFGPLLEVPMWKKCTQLWREAHFEVKMYKTYQVRATFGSSDVEKVDTIVTRSTFRSQNVKNTRGSDHF